MEHLENIQPIKELSDVTEGDKVVQNVDIPILHCEGIDNVTKDMSLDNVLEKISTNEYESNIEKNPGYLEDWRSMTVGADAKQEFAQAYKDYLINPEQLKREKPDQYAFFSEHIFNGKEYLNHQTNTDINGDANEKEVQKVISFGSSYGYCTRSSCSGWARDGEYVNC